MRVDCTFRDLPRPSQQRLHQREHPSGHPVRAQLGHLAQQKDPGDQHLFCRLVDPGGALREEDPREVGVAGLQDLVAGLIQKRVGGLVFGDAGTAELNWESWKQEMASE